MINDRVSTGYLYSSSLSSIMTTEQSMNTYSNQITSGKRFTDMGTDPSNASQVLQLNTLQNRYTQYAANYTNAKDYLNQNDSVLGQVSTLMQSAYTLALQGGDSSATVAQQQALSSQVAAIQTQLVSLANSSGSNGKYYFGGQSSTTQPYSASGGTLTFNGDDSAVNVEVRPSQTMQVNLPNGSAFFMAAYSALQSLQTNLGAGNTTAIQSDINTVQSSLTQSNVLRGQNGSILQQINNYSTDNTRRLNDISTQLSSAQDVDVASAVTSYQSAQNAYQASLSMLGKINKYNLMDFIQ